MPDQMIIEVYRDAITGGAQVAIGTLRGDGTVDLYRLAGPKFTGTGRNLLSKPLDEADAAEIRRYLDAVFPVPRSVTFKLDGDSSFILDTALGDFAARMRDRGDEWGADHARTADAMREQAETAFGKGLGDD